ncbi:CocE/NonD family hydrolase [Amycolatopsis rubida]|uniref:CocE/NonD family hydrolase n=1 Tax=Amycolatopsis rubida TaxID=112413 RepID=A0ABX0BM30_9PSEU|nr:MULTISPECIES: CocE/NonD family hydrolase [Amycolatopsis]MYW91692.1 CocE/NonD family hydrolase [Amycolatopsis rubida]NEC56676.1 CocE/NonD family hydrolase [Amycolatopsis rubida]OAP20433.1 Cocaine esterase [Amycolatopsis sp. M39]
MPKPYDVEVLRDQRIPTTDPAVTLSADVFRPAGVPAPALLTLQPYRKDLLVGTHQQATMRWFAERGYACVLVDLRGTGASDGLPRPKFAAEEGEDALAAMNWAAAQPWCTGDLGAWGISYGAVTAMRAAALDHPRLKALIAIMGPLDPSRDAFDHDGARADLHQRVYWSASMLVEQLLPPLTGYDTVEARRRWHARMYEVEPFLLDFARHGPADPALADRVLDPHSITVPAFCVGGWRDPYADAITRLYEQLPGAKQLLMGPWMHAMPQDSPYEPMDFLPKALSWWDRWLRGADPAPPDEPPVSVYVQGDGWRHYETWPPQKDELVLVAGADAVLAEEPADAFTAHYDPDPTSGALSGLWGFPSPGYGLPVDQHDDDVRSVMANSRPLSGDLVLCGRPEVVVGISEGAPERIVVRLADVDPDGRSKFIVAGVHCPAEATGQYRIRLRATAYRVPAGHRLRVTVSDSDFPRLVPLPQPEPFTLSGLELAVPAVAEDLGVPAEVSVPATRVRPSGSWSLTRDPVRDRAEVAITSGRPPEVTTADGHRIRARSDLRAAVEAAHPGASFATAEHETAITANTGEHVVVAVTIRCDRAVLWAHATVAVDGAEIFGKTWHLPLEF